MLNSPNQGVRRLFGIGNAKWYVPSVLLYIVFIVRSGFLIDGQVFFSLFDDAMISMRFARNLGEGHGLVWNAGEAAVEGYTNFLWTLWMALIHIAPIQPRFVSLVVMLSGVAILGLNLLIVARIGWSLTRSSLATGAAVALTAYAYPLIFWTLRGMEVGLLALLICAAILVSLSSERTGGTAIIISVLLSLAILTRPDALIAAVLIAGFFIYSTPRKARRRTAFILIGCLLAVAIGHTVFRLYYYGMPLPNTYYLKITGAAVWERASRGGEWLILLMGIHLAAPLVVAAASLHKSDKRAVVFFLWLLLLSQLAYSVYVGGDAWEDLFFANRYIAVVLPVLFILCGVGIDELLKMSAAQRRVYVRRAAAGTAILMGLAGVTALAATSYDATILGRYSAQRFLLGAGLLLMGLVLAGTVWLLRTRPGTPTPGSSSPAGRAFGSDRAVVWVAVGISLVFVSGPGVLHWSLRNAHLVQADAEATEVGIRLRQLTSPETSVAVVWAGAIPYFSERTSIDLLGKSDPVIARRPIREVPGRAGFYPGHMKWDYRYSVGRHRPDVIAQLWVNTEVDVEWLTSNGYRMLDNGMLVRTGTGKFDPSRLSSIEPSYQPLLPQLDR